MSQTHFSAETQEISDSTQFSVVALIGFLFSLIGIFSLFYIHMMPLTLLAIPCGAYVLLTAKRSVLGVGSKTMGFLGMAIGGIVASWGFSARFLDNSYDVLQAQQVALAYLENLSKGEMDKVNYLVGFPLDLADNEATQNDEPKTVRAKKRLSSDPVHVEIRDRRTPPKWVFIGLDGEFPGSAGHTYKLTFRDEGQTNPPGYWVYVRKDCTRGGLKESYVDGKLHLVRAEKVHWYVDNLEAEKKL